MTTPQAPLFLRDEQHRAHVERGELPPRPRSYPVTLLPGAVLIVIGLIGLGVGASHMRVGLALDARAATMDAPVVSKRIVDSDGKDYYLTYAYEVSGQRHEREAEVNADAWHVARAGSVVIIRYLPDEPATSRLHDEQPITKGLVYMLFTGFLGALGLIFAAMARHDHRAEQALRRHGALRFGTLLDVQTETDSDDDLLVTMHFQLDSADAQLHKRWLDNTLKDRLPEPGARLAVAYVSDLNFDLL